MKDMLTELIRDKEVPTLIASMPASAQQRRIAFGVVIFLSVVFAMAIPFATIQVARIDAFLSGCSIYNLFADLITAVFLFAQYSIQPQRALLALASGYIFSGLFAFLQTLDFPGAYSATGLIGGGPSGAAWLFSFWHIIFPLVVIAYVLLKDANESAQPDRKARTEPSYRYHHRLRTRGDRRTDVGWIAAEYLPSLFLIQHDRRHSFNTSPARCGCSTPLRTRAAILSQEDHPRCMAHRDGLCGITRPCIGVLVSRRPFLCRLVYGSQLIH